MEWDKSWRRRDEAKLRRGGVKCDGMIEKDEYSMNTGN
jgi:hypothetical protein